MGCGIAMLAGLVLLSATSPAIADWNVVVTAGALYIVSQGLRALRLAIIVGDPGKSLRQLVQAHLVGAAASFALPYKIGDLLRIMELAFVLRRRRNYGIWRAVLVMWIERVYDALPIAVLLFFLGVTIGEDTLRLVAPILAAMIAFIIVTLLTFFVLPENLDGLALFLARRYHGNRVVAVLRAIDRLYHLAADARRMLHRKHITLISISAVIWIAEITTVGLILGKGEIRGSATALLRFLSGLLSPTSTPELNDLSVYSVTIGLPLLVLGMIAWVAAIRSGRLSVVTGSGALNRLAAQRPQ
ncbi:MAG TPA: lysylphosphatidylglycerol synthase domain-containing protein [Dongiaceae bacterium]|nr:lysylphosphatidylglycerol synthase domain-containing protein [Dongiaceae bacterium]